MKRVLALSAALVLAVAVATAPAKAAAPYVLNGMYFGLDGAHAEGYHSAVFHWQRKSFAIVNFFAGAGWDSQGELDDIWTNAHAVPMVSYSAPSPLSLAASGTYDVTVFVPFVNTMKQFLAGPDGRIGTPDDRRAYIRFGYEPNIAGGSWSPCSIYNSGSSDPAADYIASWRRLHDMFIGAGVDNTRLAWVFSVATGDSCANGAPERVYPGSNYVDWLGLAPYSKCGGAPAQLIGPTMNRLRAIDPSKPVGINEAGVSSFRGIAVKNQWITDYWNYLHDNDLRMSVWFNDDKGLSSDCAQPEKPWSVFGLHYGDEIRTDPLLQVTYKAFSAYRIALQQPWVLGQDEGNPRRLSDAVFLGR